ncbi:hypothetical protein D7V97_24920 [Corallococcus sp. CA053C]|uniref:MopE-related protein n=1 Tax=Corallococcus sp. CA053C TaxID=2316732 RepID=UPI000EA34E00|nr:MopE-related protein [Corallococcus sp. CA053C]RKH04734.1 hypothetical protein D7V97_24920 [Corallococcus sp. CA053C]
MRAWVVVTLGAWLLCGCTVPGNDDVSLRRFCANAGLDFQDATFRLTDQAACDRGMTVEVRSENSSPGCVQVSLQDGNRRLLASTQLLGPSQVTPEQPRGLRILLSEPQGTTFRLLAESFPGNTCDGVPSFQVLQFVELPKGTVRSVQLDVSRSDADGDGHPSIATGGMDCDDANTDIHPGAVEQCDGVDNNCVEGESDAPGMRPWFLDEDSDGYGKTVMACVEPAGLLADQGGDCDDQDRFIHPGQSEFRCDGRDDNCDDAKDEGLPILTWYRDADGDGYGNVTQAVLACAQPPDHVAKATDCDDTSAAIRPEVAETKDLKDNNCNGAIDERLYPGPRMFSAERTNYAVTAAGTVWGWGRKEGVQPQHIYKPELQSITSLAVGDSHALALRQDGTVMSWGDNFSGQLGNGSEESNYLPERVSGLEDVVALAAGMHQSMALKRDGTVWVWGEVDGIAHQRRLTPVQAQGMAGIIGIVAKGAISMALRADGTVWRLHDVGSGVIPSLVPGMTGVVAIESTYNDSVVALKADGTIWEWRYPATSQVPNLTDVTAIAAGGSHVLALKQDGTVWAWRDNGYGQLGDGTRQNREVPTQVTGLSDVAALAAGDSHSLAVKQDGSVWGWGYNSYGLIDDSGENILVPKQIAGPGAWNLTSPVAAPSQR